MASAIVAAIALMHLLKGARATRETEISIVGFTIFTLVLVLLIAINITLICFVIMSPLELSFISIINTMSAGLSAFFSYCVAESMTSVSSQHPEHKAY